MDLDLFVQYCESLKGTTLENPFGDNTLVCKVMGKMYALADVDSFESINVKCDPEKAIELREQYPAVIPGYHMSKKHWNTIIMDNSIPNSQVKQWILDSYNLVVNKLTKKDRAELENL
ncbi:MmcQ/YjbR family DNA-binding protein [Polluticaenibacter yanchengensis]|uniref:MmcQ/YjbR family DNA-binding protein n=1 Tax=Polluticaenibacter yanchengensis TaxID=3014562 RepID=A0ABT4UL10_9BACT|nr:MmcQ/YjbR family DNA-binding protein [Chitinophagaceae bacterium LY-5]